MKEKKNSQSFGNSMVSFFQQCFFPYQREMQHLSHKNVIVGNTFNLDSCKILNSDKNLNIHKYRIIKYYHYLKRTHVKEKYRINYSFEIIYICSNPFPNKPLILLVCSASPLKTLFEKEKLLVTSNFSFSHSVFYRFGKLSAVFIKIEIVVCDVFEFRTV